MGYSIFFTKRKVRLLSSNFSDTHTHKALKIIRDELIFGLDSSLNVLSNLFHLRSCKALSVAALVLWMNFRKELFLWYLYLVLQYFRKLYVQSFWSFENNPLFKYLLHSFFIFDSIRFISLLTQNNILIIKPFSFSIFCVIKMDSSNKCKVFFVIYNSAIPNIFILKYFKHTAHTGKKTKKKNTLKK